MAISSLKNRIKRVETQTYGGEDLARIAELLDRGAYYDELTEEEKFLYCNYYGCDREAWEDINSYLHGNLHFKIERKPRPLTDKEFRERVREVQAYVEEAIEEYNSPEEKAKREAEYRELKRIGELRKAAYLGGEDMDQYPLPWEEKNRKDKQL